MLLWLQRTLVIIAVTLPAGAFECVFGVCEAEVDHPTQTFMGEPTEVEVTLPESGLGEFKVKVKSLDVEVDNPPVTVTLSIQLYSTNKRLTRISHTPTMHSAQVCLPESRPGLQKED